MITACSHFNEGRHRGGLRGLDQVPVGSAFKPGRFGRMFPHLPPLDVPVAALEALGAAMAEQPRDPQAIHNFRTPQLELDSIYGTGPRGMPHLYQREGRPDRARLAIGRTSDQPGGGDESIATSLPFDLPRIAESGFAVIGDPRNDENLIVAQTHLAFLKFHNAVIEREQLDFQAARKLVRWHYQWIVLHDFVGKRMVDPAVLADILANGRRFYIFPEEPFIPVEFAVAAYRVGHSMVRASYNYNRVFREGGVTPATLELLFHFSGLSGEGPPDVPVPSDWIIDWRRFYEVGDLDAPPDRARKYDTLLAEPLQNVPGTNSLAVANLKRGVARGLPSGQAVAAAMSLPPLASDVFAESAPHPDAIIRDHGLTEGTPLWYYLLKEAEIPGGNHLGPVGSRIVAEVFVGLLQGDPESFLAEAPTWTPTLGGFTGQFEMADLLNYVGELNPIG